MSPGFWLNYALALAIVALMLGGLYIIVRSLARGRVLSSARHRLVSVLESTALSQHSALHAVKVASRYLLVGTSQGAIATLAELPADEVERWLDQHRNLPARAGSLLAVLKAASGRATGEPPSS